MVRCLAFMLSEPGTNLTAYGIRKAEAEQDSQAYDGNKHGVIREMLPAVPVNPA